MDPSADHRADPSADRGADRSADRIVLRGIRAEGVHGVLPEEQVRAQPFEVDAVLTVDLHRAAETDVLADTVDYGAIIDAIARVITNEHHQLLERLADRIAVVCRSDARVQQVAVTVRKLRPPVAAAIEHVAVEIVR